MELSSQLLLQGCSQLELGVVGVGWEHGWQHLLTQDWSLSPRAGGCQGVGECSPQPQREGGGFSYFAGFEVLLLLLLQR